MSVPPPSYLTTMRRTFPQMQDVEIELMLAGDASLQKLTKRSEHHHRREAMKLLFPERVWHSFRDRGIESFARAKRAGRKELIWHGSSNSNKTGGFADLALALWWENPKATSIYITSPYEEATEQGLFARIIEQFDAAKARHKFLPGKLTESSSAITMHDRNPLSFIRLVTVDKVGKLIGKKSKSFASGMMIILADEMPDFKDRGRALLHVLKNLRSVQNFMLIGGGNFADPDDLLGRLSVPAIEGGYGSLDIDQDQEWETTRGGLVIRFDGHQSPNVLMGEDRWPFLTTKAYLADLEKTEGGQNTPGYLRFGRSFPCIGVDERTVTNATKIRAGGCYERVEWSGDPQKIGAHLDAGYGGDPCVFQPWRFGRGYVDDRTLDVFELTEAPVTIAIHTVSREDDERVKIIERQIAEACKEHLDKRRIPYSNFSFDGSMRSGLVQAIATVLGLSVTAFDYIGPATNRRISSLKTLLNVGEPADKRKVKTARESFLNFNTEIHFAVASGIDSGQVRGLSLSPAAADQLCTRRWRWSGKKREIEPKVSKEIGAKDRNWGYKQRNAGKSPNECDALVGGLEMARRLGFNLAGLTTRAGSALSALADLQHASKFRALVEGKSRSLPRGTLHSMEQGNERLGQPLHA